ncbi:RNA polymerase sigma-70 factor [Pedobacter heparinus]|uniref:RNA polymerase sigma factor n=1 Tax=Pedobacter heparinus TaxID=984 RepID=UPI0029315642|nr:RNA polymerase sigma-70 factor [Pedobacter heparinus]
MKVKADIEVEVLEGFKNGDSDAYLTIYERYHSQLYCYILRYVKIPELAEDIIHDVFLKLWEVRAQIKPELSIVGYLYRISRNQVFKFMKKISVDVDLRNQLLIKIDELEGQDSGGEELQWREYEHLLNIAINQLPPQRQKVFKLCRIEGKTYEEAATLLGISRHTVKEHMTLSLKFIKKYFYYNADILLPILIIKLISL